MNSPAQLDRALLRLAAEFFMSATAELNRVYIKYDNYFSTIFGNPILEEGNRNRDVDVQFSLQLNIFSFSHLFTPNFPLPYFENLSGMKMTGS